MKALKISLAFLALTLAALSVIVGRRDRYSMTADILLVSAYVVVGIMIMFWWL